MALTVKRVARLTRKGRFLDRDGLYLQVMSPNNRSWLLRYELHAKKHWMGLGSLKTFTLNEARSRARRARQLLADGIDPLAARRTERAQAAAAAARNKTFATVAAEYFDAHATSWSRKHRDDWQRTLASHAYPTIGALPVGTIDEPLVLNVLQPIWSDKTVTAKRLRQRIASVLDFAAAAGYRSGSNPARWEGHLQHLLAAPEKLAQVKHLPALPYSELPAFLTELRALPGIPARALEFTILTATRTNEVKGARWSEIDLKAAQWVIPSERMKAGKEHRVPLSRQAIALLRALPREAESIFVGTRAGTGISAMAMWQVLRSLRTDISVHGFRSTFRTWAEETTSFPSVVAEQALAHTIGNAVERAYRRTTLYEHRTRLMQAWADYCDKPRAAASVTPIRA
jgi:integrase